MLAVEIEKSWSDLQEAYAQIVLARRSVDSATENLRENRNFYQAGTAPLTDLLDAETLYTDNLCQIRHCNKWKYRIQIISICILIFLLTHILEFQ